MVTEERKDMYKKVMASDDNSKQYNGEKDYG